MKRFIKATITKEVSAEVFLEVDDADERFVTWFKDGKLHERAVLPVSRMSQSIGRELDGLEFDDFGADYGCVGVREVNEGEADEPLDLGIFGSHSIYDIKGSNPALREAIEKYKRVECDKLNG